MATTGNIKISELTHLGSVVGSERIPVSWKANGSSYFESYSVSAAQIGAYIDTSLGISESLTEMSQKVDSTYSYVTDSVASLSYDVTYMETIVEKTIDVTYVLDKTIEEMGGAEEFKEAIEELAYVTGDVNDLKDTTYALSNGLEEVTSYAQSIGANALQGSVKPAETTSTDITNFTCDRELENGQQYTRLIRNNGSSSITVALSTTQGYITKDGQPINLTIAAGGYGEFSFLKSDGMIFVRAL